MRSLVLLMPRRARLRWLGPVVAAVLAIGATAVAPTVAGAQQCPEATPSYFDACGPTFVSPPWGDAGGWTDPSKYSTIQLADFNGDGKDELLARNDQGLEIYWFDTTLGQWRPQVDANGVPQSLNDFRSPLPSETLPTDWTQPQYYTTIQTAHIDGNPNAQVLARFSDGMRVYYFQPGPNGSINGGRWSLISRNGPFGDADGWNVPSRYATIRTGSVTESTPGTTDLIGRGPGGLVAYDWNGSGWSALPLAQTGVNALFDDVNCSLPSCWLLFRTPELGGSGETVVGRPGGSRLELLRYDPGADSWSDPDIGGQPFSDVPGRGGDCPFPGTSDCLGSSPTYYETLGAADVNGDGADEVFARGADGLRVKSPSLTGGTTYDDQGGGISFEGAFEGAWTRAQNVPGAIDGTETSTTGGGRVEFSTDPGSLIQVIGPVGPGLGQFAVSLVKGSRQVTWVSQSAPRRREQQVLFEAIVPNTASGDVELIWGGDTMTIDAFRTYPSENRVWSSLPTLGALAGSAQSWASVPGRWASLRTGDVNADGADEVLALDGNALQAWSLGPNANAWTQLPVSNPLTLTGDWLTKPEYYATIRVGDVDGDGRDDVVARGQFGIRTWFYNRRGTGGWERYLPGGYPDFPTAGQQAAFDKFNTIALSNGAITSGKIRDQWTVKDRPDATTLSALQDKLAGPLVGNCGNETNLAPPTYGSCTPPSGSTGFTAADWTAVANQVIGEAYWAEQVVEHYEDLKTIREGVFESESGALPAIAGDLQLAGAAGNTTSFDMQGFFAGSTGIAASIAGLVPEGGAAASAALWVASEFISMLPSASQTATSTFQTTYDGLLHKFATAQDEMSDAWASQLQQVLGDQALLGLVGQLHARGTWTLDIDGMIGASRQSFALETYQALLPTMYSRYAITNCTAGTLVVCKDLPSGPYVVGKTNTSAIWLGPTNSSPCQGGYGVISCDYAQAPGAIPDSVANIVWGSVSDNCDYKPGSPNSKNTIWHYSCSLGVPPATSVGADSRGWTFPTLTGSPVVAGNGSARAAVRARPGVVRATVAHTDPSARAAKSGSSARARRNVLDPLRFRGRLALPRGWRIRRTRVVVARTLFEHGHREELAQTRSGRRLRPFALRHVRDGLFASRRRGAPGVRLRLRRLDARAVARVDLSLKRVSTRDIRALCGVLPASVSPAGRPLELETRLRLRDGAARHGITMRQRWRCVRDRRGEFAGIRPVKAKKPAARPGLSVRMRAPRLLASGRRASVRVIVANRRRARRGRLVSSLWDLRITAAAGGRARTVRVQELRAGRSRTLRLTVPVPRSARGRVCVQVAANAASARGDSARRCARVASAPPVTGCPAVAKSACARAAQEHRAARARQPARAAR